MRGAILLEVVIALTLFFIVAVFVMDGLNAAMRGVHTAELDATSADLAVTVISQVQLGVIEKVDAGPTPFDLAGYEGWTWQVAFYALEDRLDLPNLQRMEVVIRHDDDDYTHRVSQLLWDRPQPEQAESTDANATDANAPTSPGGTTPGGTLPGGLP